MTDSFTSPGDPANTKYDPRWRQPTRTWAPDELRACDLRLGLDALRTEAAGGSPGATAVLLELARLKADRALIRRYAVSKHGTHYWTGRRWRER